MSADPGGRFKPRSDREQHAGNRGTETPDVVSHAASPTDRGEPAIESFGTENTDVGGSGVVNGGARNRRVGNASPVNPEGERLQKVMAAAGVASRRVSEQFITAGRVRVNGAVVTELGRRIDPERDRIDVDGVAVQLDTSKRYVMLNKPVGVISSLSDDRGRPDLRAFTADYPERLFNVGRLDYDTSGLLLLTNDGELAQTLAHPSFGVDKTYIAKVRGTVTPATIMRLRHGFELDDGQIHADRAKLLTRGSSPGFSLVELSLHSGRNRIVRRMLDHVGHPVVELVRRSFGPLHLGSLHSGKTRELTKIERGQLLTLSRRAE